MPYFHGHKNREVPHRHIGIWADLQSLFWAVAQVLRRPHPVIRGHKRLYASSLAFKTLLALVPALALVMAVLASDNRPSMKPRV